MGSLDSFSRLFADLMGERISDLSQRIRNILRRLNKSLHADSLPQMDRAEMQECFVALEQMKMLMSELETFALVGSDGRRG
jgi:hypothetical protein